TVKSPLCPLSVPTSTVAFSVRVKCSAASALLEVQPVSCAVTVTDRCPGAPVVTCTPTSGRGTGVAVGVGLLVGEAEGGVGVRVAVAVGVSVASAVAVPVGVAVAVAVGVRVGVGATNGDWYAQRSLR